MYSSSNFRIGPVDSITCQKLLLTQEDVASNTRTVMDVMHLFILCVNLLTCFFVFLSVLSATHETDGGIYISRVFFCI